MTHPLFAVPCPVGALFMMPCPPSESLGSVIADLKAAGVSVLVSMLPEDEAQHLGVAEEATQCGAQGITFLSHPIVDFGLPQMAAFAELIQNIKDHLADGEQVIVHCKAGIGRSGMVAACVLVAFGETPTAAQRIVSVSRGTAIPDTVEQGAVIAAFAQYVKADPTSSS